jgi:hypothetical protein
MNFKYVHTILCKYGYKHTLTQRLEAMCIGAVSCRANGLQASKHTRDRPNLTRVLVAFGKFNLQWEKWKETTTTTTTISGRIGGVEWDQFPFSSIQVSFKCTHMVYVLYLPLFRTFDLLLKKKRRFLDQYIIKAHRKYTVCLHKHIFMYVKKQFLR